jgi:hypothetical protein
MQVKIKPIVRMQSNGYPVLMNFKVKVLQDLNEVENSLFRKAFQAVQLQRLEFELKSKW